MIAYSHYIKFIPELENHKKVDGSFVNTVTVKESTLNDIEDKLNYKLKFFNNQGREISLYTDIEFSYIRQGQFWAFKVKDIVTFFWNNGTFVLEYIKHEKFTCELLEYWCLHIVLPIFFTLNETYNFLHSGAVEVEGKPILFVAKSFGGKSTMTDFFMKQGHVMISDDKVATYEKDGQFFAVSSHPHHRPYRKMEDLGFFVKNFSFGDKPIHAIYELEKGDINDEITIGEVKGVEKFISLRNANEFNLYFQKPKQFDFLIRMANKVPVFKVKVPWEMNRLREVYKSIVQHSVKLKENSNN